MKRLLASSFLLLGCALALATRAQTLTIAPPATDTAPATEPALPNGPHEPLCKYVVIISIDGCRPDVLLRANTPTVHDMLRRGSFTFYAETTDVAITLPSHFSMMTGVKPEKHGINFNTDPPDDQPVHCLVPTLFDLAHQHNLTTAIASTKSKFEVFARDGSITYNAVSTESSSADDYATAKNAAAFIEYVQPRVTFLHMGNDDKVGHAKGWGSPEQMQALEVADAGIKLIFDALKKAKIDKETLVILSADHGGSGLKHGAGDPRSRYIPWIAVGPNVKKGYDLTNDRDITVHTEDTFATACYFLNLPLPPNLDGKPLKQIIPKRSLLK